MYDNIQEKSNEYSEWRGVRVMDNPRNQTYVHNTEAEEYRRKISEMVEQIENEDYLFKIYHYILAKFRRDKGQD